MSTPAAKRRRVDAANAILRKPFQSPVIRRPDSTEITPGPSKTPDTTKSAGDVYSPGSPSVSAKPPPTALRPSRSLGALRQTPNRPSPSPSSPLGLFKIPFSSSSPYSPSLAFSTTKRKRREEIEGGVGGGNTTTTTTATNPFLALVRRHRHTAQDTMLKDLDRQLDTVRQARRIEEASERKRPGEPTDQELRDLVVKWKGASRLAAEELFPIVKERVENAGGSKAWKEMRQRQSDFYRGFDQESPSKRTPADDNSERELEGDYEDEGEVEALESKGEEREEEEEDDDDDEPQFNMAQMLQSLNIDLCLLGYDEVEEKWID